MILLALDGQGRGICSTPFNPFVSNRTERTAERLNRKLLSIQHWQHWHGSCFAKSSNPGNWKPPDTSLEDALYERIIMMYCSKMMQDVHQGSRSEGHHFF